LGRASLPDVSNAKENLPAIHPKQNQPKTEQDGGAVQEWLIGVPDDLERVLSKMGLEVFENEAVEQMRDAISRD
jgi:hypothetical protein